MDVQEQYTGKDFKRYARKEFPNEFTAFRNAYTCVFERKTYFDDNSAIHDIDAVLVGNYRTRNSGPAVWAQASDIGVHYYSGRPTERRCYPISEVEISRIYFEERYSSIIGTSREKSRTPGRKPGHSIVETVISVLFLLTSRLERVGNPHKTDMLSNFKHVCLITASEANAREVVVVDSAHRSEDSPGQLSVEHVSKKHKRTARNRDDRSRSPSLSIKEENGADVDHKVASSRNHTARLSQHHSPMPIRPSSHTPLPSLFDQIRSYENEVQFRHEREKEAHDAELNELRLKLREHEFRTQDAEDKLKGQEILIDHLEDELNAQKMRAKNAEIRACDFEEKLEQQKRQARSSQNLANEELPKLLRKRIEDLEQVHSEDRRLMRRYKTDLRLNPELDIAHDMKTVQRRIDLRGAELGMLREVTKKVLQSEMRNSHNP